MRKERKVILPTAQEEKNAPLDEVSKVVHIAQTVGDCIAFNREFGECDDVNLNHISAMLRAGHRWHIQRAQELAKGVAA